MNNVRLPIKATPQNVKFSDVVNSGETAFIGQCGYGPEHSLYLVVYEHIVLAEHPRKTWELPECTVIVDRYVDVEIIVREK